MNVKRILVINVARIGDTVLATPAIRALSVAWPNAQITVMGHPKRVEVIENLPYVHKVESITKKTAPWKDRFGRRRWDLAVVFGFDEALIRYALRVATSVYAWKQKDPVLNQRISKAITKPENDSVTAVDLLNTLPCEALNIKPAGKYLDFVATPEERERAMQRIQSHWPHKPSPLIGIVLESFPTKPYRDWPLEHFLSLCDRVLQDYPDAGFVLLGGDHTKTKLEAFRQRFGSRVAVMAGSLSLRETGSVMSCLDLYLGCDTGPSHMAGALKTVPMIVLYHYLHRSWVLAPQEHKALSVLDHPAPDGQCSASDTMAEISVETVYQEVRIRLGEPQ